MRNTIIIALFSLVIAGCSKNKFTTKPQLKFKKLNTNFVPRDGVIEVTLQFTDKEGDFLPGKLFVQRLSSECPADTNFKTVELLPDFPTTADTEGDIIVSYSNGNIFGYRTMSDVPGICADTTVCFFRFALEDKAGNKSDTIVSPPFAISKF